MFDYNSVYVVDVVLEYLDCMHGVWGETSSWARQLLPEVVCYHEVADAVVAIHWLELGQMVWPLN